MKKLFLILILTSFVCSNLCGCLCCKKTATTTKSNVPMVYKNDYSLTVTNENKAVVLVDKPVVAKQIEPVYYEESSQKINNEFDECVAECKANNVSSSVIDFCIKETCGRLK